VPCGVAVLCSVQCVAACVAVCVALLVVWRCSVALQCVAVCASVCVALQCAVCIVALRCGATMRCIHFPLRVPHADRPGNTGGRARNSADAPRAWLAKLDHARTASATIFVRGLGAVPRLYGFPVKPRTRRLTGLRAFSKIHCFPVNRERCAWRSSPGWSPIAERLALLGRSCA
jgi:hypothetical protein